MPKSSVNPIKGSDYIPEIEELMANGKGEMTVNKACELVAEKWITEGRRPPDLKKQFIATIKRAYYRKKEKEDAPSKTHGNQRLTNDEEHLLVGFIQAKVRTGEKMSRNAIITFANTLFDKDPPLDRTWYGLFNAFDAPHCRRYRNFKDRHKKSLKFLTLKRYRQKSFQFCHRSKR